LLHLRRLVPCNCASVAVFDSNSNEPRLLAVECAPGSSYVARAHPIAIYERAQPGIDSSNEPILTADLWALETTADLFQALRQGGAISYAALPLHGEHRLLGMLELVDREVGAFTPADVQAARTIADQLAIALQQAMLRDDIDRHAASLEQHVRERTEALEQTNRRLTEVNRDLEDFTAYAAHDLRSPLNAMTSQCGLLRGRLPPADDEARQRMDRIDMSVRRMNDVIDGMLGLARLSKIELTQRRVDLDAMAADIIQDLRQQYPSHPVQYTLRCGSPIHADPRLMRSLLLNLLSNAWKYTTKTANPTVELVRVATEAVPTYFIRDNGAGFDMEYAQHLFEPFRRMHTITQFPGVGIGLATVARIIHRYGGTIRADSRVGSGTVFHFTLPQAADHKEAVSGWRLAVSETQED
jgi:signal transduction histidine kinase